jgi:mono/diheme cytochrome c family protein
MMKIQSKKLASKWPTLVSLGLSMGFMLAALPACTGGDGLSKQPNVELIQDMMDQPALKAQDSEPGQLNKAASRIPPEGTVPVGYKPYPYPGQPETAAQRLKNPVAGNMTPQLLEVGRRKYEIYCQVCHGETGAGDGPVAVKMASKPPPVTSDKIKKMSDGGIYHIITDGQGLMGSYAYQIVKEEDRWALVNYVRNLQKLSERASTKQ